jgi:hypothetical protein
LTKQLTRAEKQAIRKKKYGDRQVAATKPVTSAARDTYNQKLASGVIKSRPATAQTTVQGALQPNGDHALFLTNKVDGIPSGRSKQVISRHKVITHTLNGIPVLTTVKQPTIKPKIRAIITPDDYVTIGKVSDRSIEYYCAKTDLIERKKAQ